MKIKTMNKTTIPWADYSWNPITGCSRISTGCKNCYCFAMNKRFENSSDVMFHEDRLEIPMDTKIPGRVFVCSMGDIFHDDVKKAWIDKILEIIQACPQHTFIMLTKRPENIEDKFYGFDSDENPCRELGGGDYLDNLWLGVTAENQEMFDQRVPVLLSIPAAVHFVSVEPMLGRLYIKCVEYCKLDWLICGAESGTGKRHMNIGWAHDLRNQCNRVGIPFFFKVDSDGKVPDDLNIREFPKETK